MSNIVRPPKERSSYSKYSAHTNEAVNLDLVLTVTKAREAYYPDNEGIPVIRFWFGDKNYHQWYFDRGEESQIDNWLRLLDG